MKTRTGLLITTAVSSVLIGLGSGSQALAADLVTKAPPALAVGWWSSVFVEVGGRFDIEKNGGGTGGNFLTGPNGATTHLSAGPFPSLGKFYQYNDLRQGPFGELFVAGGSNDGLYQYAVLAKNIGYRDQSYVFDWSTAGVWYLTLGYDQLPHTYNDNATTIYRGVGSDNLTIDPAVRAALSAQLGPTSGSGTNSPTAAGRTNIANIIEGNLAAFRLGFDRYSGSAAFRATPTDNWDVKVDYNITRRDGTQPQGALTYNGVERSGRVILEVPKPIHDETHTANINVEYAGVTPWGKKFNVNGGYGTSIYRDDSDSFTFQNPWAVTQSAAFPTFTPLNNLMSLPPSNMANFFRVNGSLELPWNTRWVSTVNYTVGKQDQGFLPFSTTPGMIGGTGFTNASFVSNGVAPVLSGGSSNFGSNNLLFNNVLTTKWTSELSQTTRYRYYDYDASHTPITASYLLLADSGNAQDADDGFISQGVSYTKQNAGTDFTWRPATVRWLTLGGGVAWEQWDRHWRGSDPGIPDVAVTNEFMGTVFANAKPFDWSQLRSSYTHAERRFDGTYTQNIGGNDESCAPSCTGFRAYDLANRDRDKLNVFLDLYAPFNVTITPTGGFRYDDYSKGMILDANGGGLVHDNTWNAGVDVSWSYNRTVSLIGSYMREEGHRQIWVPFTSHSLAVSPPFATDVDAKTDSFMAGANFVIIPKTWDIKLAYTLVLSTASIGAPPANPVTGSFPDQNQTTNRVDVQSKYRIDPGYLQQVGFNGEAYFKLRYLWEHNEVSDWAAVNWNYMYLFNGDATTNKNLSLGWNNPNYNVQLLMASLALKW
jgi:MtrB/PioB family decaheme-associated outer membrane protein